MSNELERFQSLLRELFQFDCADLDFGIYRILNARRGLFEDWLTQRLPHQVREALSEGALQQDAQHAERMQRLAGELREEYGEDCLDGDGKLNGEIPNRSARAREYRELWQMHRQRGAAEGNAALEADIYNRLYDFFRRYYEDGDFLSLRRYGAANHYAVPYNGEEVLLHWANKDQYYIKTGEHFTDYRFRAGDSADAWTVEFKLTSAEADRDNTQSNDKRFFFFEVSGAETDAGRHTLTIPVQFRAVTEAEKAALPNRNVQDKLNEDAEQKLLAQKVMKAQPTLAQALARNVSDDPEKPQTLLARHLRRYTRKNTSDFFIHKDLGGFLNRELDYWLKAEVLKLDALLAGSEQPAQAWLQRLGILREIGAQIIAFLAQVEDFQKHLFEKRKFITEYHWCITLDHVERAGLTEELAKLLNETEGGKRQKDEWKKLFAVDEIEAAEGRPGWKEKVTPAFLRSQPYLVLDTVFMPREFTDKLLASFEDLDAQTNGVLVHSENFQALNLLMERYREQVQCVYIDPPYNSKTSEIAYKNTYKHSSWLSLMQNRLALSRNLSTRDGSHIVAIDENEQEVLGRVINDIFATHENVCVAVVHNKKGIQGDYFSFNHEYMYFSIPGSLPETHGERVPEQEWEYTNLRKWGRESERSTAKNCFYPIVVKNGEIVAFGDVCDESVHPPAANVRTRGGVEVFPIDGSRIERKWRYARDTVESIKRLLRVHVTRSGEIQILKAVDEKPVKTIWDDARYIAGDFGTRWLTDLGLKIKEDLYPKSVHLVADAVYAVSDPDAIVFDYFGGSGTTGHSIINLNRTAQIISRRSFILTEMGDYFDTVLKPRIEKVIYSKDWKDGKPVSREGSSHVVKYFRMESYEDSLSNLVIRSDGAGQSALELMGDAYRLGYWLDFDTQGSATCLNIEQLASPFDYTLAIHDGRETQVKPVDLPETFTYLLGLIVQRRRALEREGRRYLLHIGTQRANGARTAVLWRDIRDWDEDDFDAERKWAAKQKLFEGCTAIFVNGDSAIEGAQSLDPVFKARMFAPVH